VPFVSVSYKQEVTGSSPVPPIPVVDRPPVV
jgi:hypothetical protein